MRRVARYFKATAFSWWLMLVCCLALAVHSGISHADTLWLQASSYHFDRSARLNERNPGVLYEADNGLVLGTYLNSYREQSVLAGYIWRPVRIGPVDAGLMAGAATGYKSPVGAAVLVRYRQGPLSVQGVIVPVPGGVALVQVGWSL